MHNKEINIEKPTTILCCSDLNLIIVHSGVAKIKICNITFIIESRSMILIKPKIRFEIIEIIEKLNINIYYINYNNTKLYTNNNNLLMNNYLSPIIYLNEIDYILINKYIKNKDDEMIIYYINIYGIKYNCKLLNEYKEFDIKTTIENYLYNNKYKHDSLRNFADTYGYSYNTIKNYYNKNKSKNLKNVNYENNENFSENFQN